MSEENNVRLYSAIEAMNESVRTFVDMFPDLAKQVGDLQASFHRFEPKIELLEQRFDSLEPVGKESMATRIHILELWQQSQIQDQREMKSVKVAVALALIGALASIIAVIIK